MVLVVTRIQKEQKGKLAVLLQRPDQQQQTPGGKMETKKRTEKKLERIHSLRNELIMDSTLTMHYSSEFLSEVLLLPLN